MWRAKDCDRKRGPDDRGVTACAEREQTANDDANHVAHHGLDDGAARTERVGAQDLDGAQDHPEGMRKVERAGQPHGKREADRHANGALHHRRWRFEVRADGPQNVDGRVADGDLFSGRGDCISTESDRHVGHDAKGVVEVKSVEHLLHRPPVRPGLPESERLVTAVARALRSSAAVLQGGPRPDVAAIDVARQEHRSALDRWAAAQLRAGRPVEEVLDGLDFDHTLRVVSYVTVALGGNAITAAGKEIAVGDTAIHVLRTIRTHLESPSTVMHGTIRVAIRLALAVWLARAFDLSHAFWVVLGPIQVLRTNALGTGRTIVQAVVGNVIGVVIGGLFALGAGRHPAVIWTAFPIAVFGAAYAATTIGFMLSQAAFPLKLSVGFNRISPPAWAS